MATAVLSAYRPAGFTSSPIAAGAPATAAQIGFRDRTQELRSIFDMLKQNSTSSVAAPGSAAASSSSALTAPARRKPVQQQTAEQREFNDATARFSVDLSTLAETVANLTRLTQHSGAAGSDAFDENSQEIGKLTTVVRTRLQALHDDLNRLAGLKEQSDASMESRTMAKHNDAVVSALRSKLVGTGNNFRSLLQKRTQSMKDATMRRSKLLADRSGGTALGSDADTTKVFRAAFNGGAAGAADSGAPDASGDGSAPTSSTALTLQNRNLNYLRDRQAAVHEIEMAVREVSEIVQDFTRLVYEQDETIVRIDHDVEEAATNVTEGTGELMKYLASLTSQRGMILKIMGILFCFLLFFGFFIVR